MELFDAHSALKQRTSSEGFFKKLFSYFFQRQAFGARLRLEAGLGLRVELDTDSHAKIPLLSRLNVFGVNC